MIEERVSGCEDCPEEVLEDPMEIGPRPSETGLPGQEDPEGGPDMVRKVSATIPVSEEVLQDAEAASERIDLAIGLRLAGFGSPRWIRGKKKREGAYWAGFYAALDAIRSGEIYIDPVSGKVKVGPPRFGG